MVLKDINFIVYQWRSLYFIHIWLRQIYIVDNRYTEKKEEPKRKSHPIKGDE